MASLTLSPAAWPDAPAASSTRHDLNDAEALQANDQLSSFPAAKRGARARLCVNCVSSGRREADLQLIMAKARLARLHIFRPDGFPPEAAPEGLSGPIELPLVTYGLITRHNDRAPSVGNATVRTRRSGLGYLASRIMEECDDLWR